VLDDQFLSSIIRNQVDWELLIKPQVILVEQANDRSDPIISLGLPDPSIYYRLRHLAAGFLTAFRSRSTGKFILDHPTKHDVLLLLLVRNFRELEL
jgi:hypothetical protein